MVCPNCGETQLTKIFIKAERSMAFYCESCNKVWATDKNDLHNMRIYSDGKDIDYAFKDLEKQESLPDYKSEGRTVL